MKSSHVLFGRNLFSLPLSVFILHWVIQKEGLHAVFSLNIVSCTALLPGTLEEGQEEGSLDLDQVACSFHLHQVCKYPSLAALRYSYCHQTYRLLLDQSLFS